MIARTVRLRDFDPFLMIAALSLVALGALLIYSGTFNQYGTPSATDLSHPVVRQGAFAAVGLALALILTRLDYRILGSVSGVIYVAGVASLALVLAFGDETFGSRRWITIAGTPVQPSEIAKLLVIIALAKYLADRHETIRTLRVFLTSLAMAAIPIALVLAEPDLGSAIIFAAIWFGLVIVAGANWRHLAGLFGVSLVAAPFLLLGLQDYQRERIQLWLDPERDPLGGGFNILQAKISVGSGGLFGTGITEGTQTQLDYLRTETTDYVFSVLGEELGFIGAMVLFALFIVFLLRTLRVAELSQDVFGRLIATGIAVFVLLQVFINVGVNIGLLPVTGIPLPFVSQGGSSLISLFAAIGILQSILLRHRPFTFRTFYGA